MSEIFLFVEGGLGGFLAAAAAAEVDDVVDLGGNTFSSVGLFTLKVSIVLL